MPTFGVTQSSVYGQGVFVSGRWQDGGLVELFDRL
jgi:hypothetical protein